MGNKSGYGYLKESLEREKAKVKSLREDFQKAESKIRKLESDLKKSYFENDEKVFKRLVKDIKKSKGWK